MISIATSLRATWGLPDLSVLLAGLLGIGAAGALGYAAGVFLPSRFTPPLVAVALFFVQQLATSFGPGVRYLSPLDWTSYDVFHGVRLEVGLLQVVWFSGLAVMALVAVAAKRHRSTTVHSGIAAAAIAMLAGALPLLLVDFTVLRPDRNLVPYEPVCEEQGITVCVHPAFEAVLPEVAGIAERLTAPLAGVPGVPTRAEQWEELEAREASFPSSTFPYDMRILTSRSNAILRSSKESRMGVVARSMARGLVEEAPDRRSGALLPVQAVVGTWLLKQAGFPERYEVKARVGDYIQQYLIWLTFGGERLEAAMERFDALDPEVRRAWLEDNFAALRAGELTLEDLP